MWGQEEAGRRAVDLPEMVWMPAAALGTIVLAVSVALGAGAPAVAEAAQFGADVRLAIESPRGEVQSPTRVCGWALDLGAHPRPGVDVAVEVYVTNGRQDLVAHVTMARPDIAALYGVQDANVGWCAEVAVPPGPVAVVVTATSRRAGGGSVQRSIRLSPMVWGPVPSAWPLSLWSWTNYPKAGQVLPASGFSVIGVARDFGGTGIREVRLFTVNRATPHELPVWRGYAAHNLPHNAPFWQGFGYQGQLVLAPGVYDLIVEAEANDGQVESRVTRIEVR